jgi:formylglycine-generating enzyme required for sulfatase activity
MSRFLVLIALALFMKCAAAQSVDRNVRPPALNKAESRVALVIGNAAYGQGPLKNPVNDARSIAARLKTLGFDVIVKENLKQREIGSVYREFRTKITPGGTALVFYAGHGLQVKGQNYFPAVDSSIDAEEDVPLQSLNLGTLLENMEEAKAGVSLVMLDACRDNPFARRFRSASRGLAKVEAASGTLIHYATKPGSVAADGEGKNGTYTEALLAQMGEPGLPVELMLKKVANRVVEKTKGKQEPWIEGSLRGDFYFIFQGPTSVTVQSPGTDAETLAWQAAEQVNTEGAYRMYLESYSKGRYAAVAKIRLVGFKKPTTVAETAKPPLLPVSVTELAPGQTFKDCAECPDMVVIPGNIAMGRTEVTQRQWEALMGNNPSEFKGCADCPVEMVNWDDAQGYVRKLTEKTGKRYRLPSEEEWEYACHAGRKQVYCGSDDLGSAAWYGWNSEKKTRPVAGKQPNGWGLYDMSGNVSEWTGGCWDGNCDRRVPRGGAWNATPQTMDASSRDWANSTFRRMITGLRPVRELDHEAATKSVSAQSETSSGGLEWAGSDNGADIDWRDATSYCVGKGRGWRLPTSAELQANYQNGHPTLCGGVTCKVVSNSRLTGPWFWSNEQSDLSHAWGLLLTNGVPSASHVLTRDASRALCVRRP